ncbi:MAG: hypothetical protein ACE5D0_06590 [Fidelibacterota bacterium]
MMSNRITKTIHRHIGWLFCLALISQNVVESPVLCFESDGHINLESDCDHTCIEPTQNNDEHIDDCRNCVDISFWNYNPDLSFLVRSIIFDYDMYESNQELFSQELVLALPYVFQPSENPHNHFPSFLKNTALLI